MGFPSQSAPGMGSFGGFPDEFAAGAGSFGNDADASFFASALSPVGFGNMPLATPGSGGIPGYRWGAFGGEQVVQQGAGTPGPLQQVVQQGAGTPGPLQKPGDAAPSVITRDHLVGFGVGALAVFGVGLAAKMFTQGGSANYHGMANYRGY